MRITSQERQESFRISINRIYCEAPQTSWSWSYFLASISWKWGRHPGVNCLIPGATAQFLMSNFDAPTTWSVVPEWKRRANNHGAKYSERGATRLKSTWIILAVGLPSSERTARFPAQMECQLRTAEARAYVNRFTRPVHSYFTLI